MLGIVIGAAWTVHEWMNRDWFSWPSYDADRTNDPVLGYTTVELKEMIAGKAREKKELIIYEQDFEASVDYTDMLWNIDWFAKTQTVHMYGTASYTVDLDEVGEDDVTVDEIDRKIIVTIPHAAFRSIEMDYDKTTFDDIERKIFGWGDIKLNSEQQNLVQKSMQEAMEEEASSQSAIERADEAARKQVSELYSDFLKGVDLNIKVEAVTEE